MHSSVFGLTESDVDALAAGELVVRDDFLDTQTVGPILEILQRWHLEGQLVPAGVGKNGDVHGVRGDHITWLEPHHEAPMSQLFGCFEQLRVDISNALRLGLPRFTVQVAHYGPGAGYKRHLDAFRGDPTRLITAIVYLNPSWEPAHGGQLRAWSARQVRDVEPVLGRLVVFRSDSVPHEVLPSHASRWAATAWYRGSEAVPLLPDA